MKATKPQTAASSAGANPDQQQKAAIKAGNDPRTEDLVKGLSAYFKRHRLNPDSTTDRATVGRGLGYADGSTVYRYLNIEKWDGGNLTKFETRLEAFLENELRLIGGGELINDPESFVIPSVFAFLDHARRGRMVNVGYGEAGAGKTCACKLYAAAHRSTTCYVHVWEWTSSASALVAELMTTLQLEAKGKETPTRTLARHLRDKEMMLIIDNAHELNFSARKMLADLVDFAGTPVALIGNEEIIDQWRRKPQHKRRVSLKSDVTMDLYDAEEQSNTVSKTLDYLMMRHLPELAANKDVKRKMMSILKTRKSGACGSVVMHAHHTKIMMQGGIKDPLEAFRAAQEQLLSDAA